MGRKTTVDRGEGAGEGVGAGAGAREREGAGEGTEDWQVKWGTKKEQYEWRVVARGRDKEKQLMNDVLITWPFMREGRGEGEGTGANWFLTFLNPIITIPIPKSPIMKGAGGNVLPCLAALPVLWQTATACLTLWEWGSSSSPYIRQEPMGVFCKYLHIVIKILLA